MLPNSEVHEVNLQDYLKIVQKRIGVILAFVIIIPSAVTIVNFATKPIYRSTVSILIEQASPRITKIEEVTSYRVSQEYYQTQYKILSSRNLAEHVFQELHLGQEPDFQGVDDPAGILYNEIKIEPVKNSQIVLVHVDDPDALRGSSIANAFANAYIQDDIETRNRAAKEATGWLESQLSGIKDKLRQAEEALNKYVQENKIVDSVDIEKKTQRLLEDLKGEKSKLETEVAEASKRYKQKHPKMMALKARLDEVNVKIEKETSRFLELYQKMVQYNILKEDVGSNQKLYASILNRSKETLLAGQLKASSIRIVDSARPAKFPYKPKKARNILTSLVLSLFSGVSVAFLLEYLDSSLRTADDISLYLDLPFLGYIPSIGQEIKTDKDRSLVCFTAPKSIYAESCRAIRTATLFASPEDKPLKSLLFTSAVPQEGKTLVSTNMAIIFSQLNEKVVLIDIDMRRPKLHHNFNIDQKTGLSNFLTGNASLDMILKPSPMPNLSLISSGNIPPNPSELISSSKIRQLFEELESRFDRIVVDAPPILSATDASLLANMLDGAILVVKGGYARIEAVKQAKEKLIESKGKIIGVIINDVQPQKEDSYYYYHYYDSDVKKK